MQTQENPWPFSTITMQPQENPWPFSTITMQPQENPGLHGNSTEKFFLLFRVYESWMLEPLGVTLQYMYKPEYSPTKKMTRA